MQKDYQTNSLMNERIDLAIKNWDEFRKSTRYRPRIYMANSLRNLEVIFDGPGDAPSIDPSYFNITSRTFCRFNSSNLYVNFIETNASESGNTSFSTTFNSSNDFGIGYVNFSNPFFGNIMEILIFNGQLTGSEHTKLLNHLDVKWN